MTRGFPLDPRAGERVDHPHHVGLWFNYGDVNGIDFWNNSDAITAERTAKMGTIVHKAIAVGEERADRRRARGRLRLGDARRLGDPEGAHEVRLRAARATTRTIDRITTLTAGATRVDLKDNKEGVLGLRVTRALEEPVTKPEMFTDAQGKPD